jgi:small subunit ribosomal protein S1
MMNSVETPVAALQPKAKLTGTVTKVTLAGALVDVGQSLPGVLHISQLQQNPVQKVHEVLHEGQSVEVWVRRVRKDRIELTMIEPLRYDWTDLQPEMVVSGKVVRLEPYGAFLDIGAERPGMIHVSELARGYVKAASDVVKEGEEVEAKIISVDTHKRQIRLSLKALQPELEEAEKPRQSPRRGRRGKAIPAVSAKPEDPKSEEPSEPELTAMQIAWQTAQDRAKSKGKVSSVKRRKPPASEQEEILNRTLEKRMPTGA